MRKKKKIPSLDTLTNKERKQKKQAKITGEKAD